MQYFRNVDLTKLYPISEAGVRKWIEAAQRGRLDLKLCRENNKTYVANTPDNLLIIERLIGQRKKYINARALKAVTPSPEFYKLFTAYQIMDIASNISIHGEIPHGYSYVGGGAADWDRYTTKLLSSKSPNLLTSTIDLLEQNQRTIDQLIEPHKKVNVIDLGTGNCLPARQLLSRLKSKGQLHRYIGIDISQDMLDIAKRNIDEWFGGQIKFEGHVRNISHDRFNDLLTEDYFDGDDTPINLILLFGGTLSNLRSPDQTLQVIQQSMSPGDLLIYDMKLDCGKARLYFDFVEEQSTHVLSKQEKLIPDLLGIDDSLYEVEQFYDKDKCARFIRLRLKVMLSISFKFGTHKKVIDLDKGDTILLWRSWHQSAFDIVAQFERSGFELRSASISKDREYILTISEIKSTQQI
ncbi:MAG TPA: L-histidine N(alpha)-methyltransferase [Patescibacteria group bacterium]|nr:L-histidine N(alpha)-methyltransferase [Patescibacteria group bacterium]